MSQLTFQACIFNGAICSACGVALDNAQMRPSRFFKHREDHHPEMALDARAELARVKDIMNDAAKCLAAFHNNNNGKLQFCEMFLTQADVLWCSHVDCGRAYKNEGVHSGRARAVHRESNSFSQKNMKYPKMPNTYYSSPQCYSGHTKNVPGSRRTCTKSHRGHKTGTCGKFHFQAGFQLWMWMRIQCVFGCAGSPESPRGVSFYTPYD